MMKQQVILITGATSGFGKAIGEALLARGHKVYGTGRHPQTTQSIFPLLTMDVCHPESIKTALGELFKHETQIDCLINNAGMGIAGAVELATPDEIQTQLGTNFMGAVNICREVVPIMRNQGYGRIINMSSIGGIFTVPYQGYYCISKRAICAYTEALALEVEAFGISTALVHPGDFCTGFTGNRKVSALTEQSVDYANEFKTVLSQIEHDEMHGGKAPYLAHKVVKIVESRHPNFNNIITKDPLQRLSVLLYFILPYPLFKAMLRKFYHM